MPQESLYRESHRDFGFMLGMFLLFRTFGTLDFTQLFEKVTAQQVPQEAWGVFGPPYRCLPTALHGGMRQIRSAASLRLASRRDGGPDAGQRPDPRSHDGHRGSLRCARSHLLFEHSETALVVVAIVGCATALFAATIGLVQTDIKKVLAYSTVSQLGYMFLACGVGASVRAFFIS